MYKLVVLSALLVVAASKPTHPVATVPLAHGITPLAYAAPAHSYAYAAHAPTPLAYAAPAHSYAYAAHAPVVAAPVAAAAITKTVHYAETPVVTGYTSTIYKPDLGHLATPPHTVSQTPVVAPARAVETVIPQVTQVEPELHVQKVPVDVPVHTPVVSEVEVRTPVVQGPAVVSAPVHAAPAVHAAPVAHAYHAAPLAHGYAAPLAHGYAAPLAHGYAAPLAHGYAAPYAHGYAAPYAHAW